MRRPGINDPLLLRALEFSQGRLSRRDFLRAAARAGLVCASPWFLHGCGDQTPLPEESDLTSAQSASNTSSDAYQFLTNVGRRYANTEIHVLSESTPPSLATQQLATKEFEALTGIRVQWDLLPLDKVLAKLVADTGLQRGDNDIYYLDQVWIARFAPHVRSPSEWLQMPALAYPNYAFHDILQPLVEQVATYRGTLVGIPYDIPILLMMYREDLLDRFRCAVPHDLNHYIDVVRKIGRDSKGQVFGTSLQWKLGHFSLVCDTCAWLWAHGGQFYDNEGVSQLENGAARSALTYMLELGKYAPPESTTFDWNGQTQNFAQGQAAIMTSWGEFFPSFDDPRHSSIIGLAQAAPCPIEAGLKSPQACGFGEHPGMSRQGGSCLALSRYSRNPEAAWIFLQWATSADITTRACLLGGGSSPIRASNYLDPRVLARRRIGPGTTRHFAVVKDAIEHRMGTEPHFPGWTDLANDHLALQLSRLLIGQQDVPTTLQHMAEAANQAARDEMASRDAS